MGNVKGTAIVGRLEYARRRGGDEAVSQLVAAITDPAARELLADGRALKNLWYPFSTLVEITAVLDQRFGKGDWKLAEEVGRDVAVADMSSVYRIFLKVADPTFIIDKARMVWRSYYSSGDLAILERSNQAVLMELRDFDTPHLSHCYAVLGWMRATLEMSGTKNLVLGHTKCRARGEGQCLFDAKWE